ncbi:MAG: carbonic anhydrase, partial [Rhodococcus sp.]|nr:carbonic anhydrase [Rhodococcus sp. (in: high G+C Gram-positive bacteria)]
MGRNEGLTTVDELEARHVKETGSLLMQRSRILAEKVEQGTCAIVGVTYKLTDGQVKLKDVIGDVGEVAG